MQANRSQESNKIYVIHCPAESDDSFKKQYQELINETNHALCREMGSRGKPLPEWMNIWQGPLIYEDIDEEARELWVRSFQEVLSAKPLKGVDLKQYPSRTIPIRDKPIIKCPEAEWTAQRLRVPDVAGNQGWYYFPLVLFQFSHYTYAPLLRQTWVKEIGYWEITGNRIISSFLDFLEEFRKYVSNPDCARKIELVSSALFSDSPRPQDMLSLIPVSLPGHQTYLAVKKGETTWTITYYDRARDSETGIKGFDNALGKGYTFYYAEGRELKITEGEILGYPVCVEGGDWGTIEAVIRALKSKPGDKSQDVIELMRRVGDVKEKTLAPPQRAQHQNTINCMWGSLEAFLLDELGRDCFEDVKLGFRRHLVLGCLGKLDELKRDGSPDYKRYRELLASLVPVLMRARDRADRRRPGSGRVYDELLEKVMRGVSD